MGRRYSIDGEDTNTASTTILELRSTTAIRPRIYDFLLSSDATPADNAGDYLLQRTTTAGTSTAVTPQALDPGDPAAVATAGKAHSAEPTYTSNAILLHVALNQRATFRWVAAPGGEIVLPAAANGVGLLVSNIGGSAVNVGACAHFEE
jgi:hypothetical protein